MTASSSGPDEQALEDGPSTPDGEAEELLSLIEHMSTFRGPANRVDLPAAPADPNARPEGQPIEPAEVLPPTIARPGVASGGDPAASDPSPTDGEAADGEPQQTTAGEPTGDDAAVPAPAARPLARSQARTRAIEILFAAEVRERGAEQLMDDRDIGWVDAFTRTLVTTVATHAGQLDEIIEKFARGWTVDRMPNVDRCILRLGLAELMHLDEVPPRVAIDEAVELAKVLSTDDSPKFVNGVLAAVARDRDLL